MSEKVTESRVLINRGPENEFMREWCAFAAERGGRFSIKQDYVCGNWHSIYTIYWPEGVGIPAELKEDADHGQ